MKFLGRNLHKWAQKNFLSAANDETETGDPQNENGQLMDGNPEGWSGLGRPYFTRMTMADRTRGAMTLRLIYTVYMGNFT